MGSAEGFGGAKAKLCLGGTWVSGANAKLGLGGTFVGSAKAKLGLEGIWDRSCQEAWRHQDGQFPRGSEAPGVCIAHTKACWVWWHSWCW